MTRILVTGGAGFVGSYLARQYAQNFPRSKVIAFDNLKRRGSELNLTPMKKQGIEFVHGDVRNLSDLEDLEGSFDLLIEASAEPSVHAGVNGSPQYVIQTNLSGTLNCLEFARKRVKNLIFLSTSRVYSIQPLRDIALAETGTRFELKENQAQIGVSSHGISEKFATHLPRSIYGATKLASELLIQEYVNTFGMQAIINRCGVIAGPGQFGRTDQGVFTLWVANHYFKKHLKYTGFGGLGKQVRDLLHPQDLYDLIQIQLTKITEHSGGIFNIGGGREISTSLLEYTKLCQTAVGHEIRIDSEPESASVDIPIYLSDTRLASQTFGWSPKIAVPEIVKQIHEWIKREESQLGALFG